MSGKIKGVTIEIGGDTTGLDNSLKSVNSTVKKTQSELNQVNRLLKFDPSNTTLLAQKQELLSKQIQNTSEKLKTLKQVQQQVNDQFASGKINGEQFRAFQREIAKAESDLRSFKSQADNMKVGIEVKANTVAINKTKSKLKELGPAAKAAGKEMADGIKVGAAGVTAATAGLVTGMQEFNGDMARLSTNAQKSGNDLSAVKDGFVEITAVTGETDSAVETMSNLLATGFTDNQLKEVINDVNGAAIKFSDTLKTEGIADGIQETFATGKAVGQFGELLDRSGVDLNTFNKGLAEAQKQGQGTNYVMETLSKLGLSSVTEEYKKSHKEIYENAKAQAEAQIAMGNLAKQLSPLVTKITEIITKLTEWAAANPTLMTTIVSIAGVITALTGVLVALSPVFSAISAIALALGTSFGVVAGVAAGVIAAIAAIIAIGVLLYKNWDTVKATLLAVWQGIKVGAIAVFNAIKTTIATVWNGIKAGTTATWNGIKSVLTTVWNGLKTGVTTAFNSIKTAITTVWNGVKSVTSTVWNAIKTLVNTYVNTMKSVIKTAFNLMKAIVTGDMNGVKSIISTVWNTAKTITSNVVNSMKAVISRVFNAFKSVVGTAMNNVKTAISSGWDKAKSFLEGINLSSIGRNIIEGLINGIKNAGKKISSAVKSIADSIPEKFKDILGIHSPAKFAFFRKSPLEVQGGIA